MLQHAEINELKNFTAKMYLDTALLCKTLFPNVFRNKFSSLHQKIFSVIDAKEMVNGKFIPKYKKILIIAPRGLGKSSIACEGISAKSVLYQDTRFLMYVSKSATHAELMTENLKTALMESELVEKLFGRISARSDEGVQQTFSKKSWVTNNDVLVMPRGAGQQVRGLRYKEFRPQRIIIDDLEDTESIENIEYRNKTYNWLMSDLINVVALGEEDYQFVYIDTLKHADSVAARLKKRSEWKVLELSLCDENYNSLAPEFKTTEQIMAEVEEHRHARTLDIFYREMMAKPISKEDATFKQEYFVRIPSTDEAYCKALRKGHIENIVIVDPAKTAKMHNAESAIVVWGVDLINRKYYFRRCVRGHFYPEQLYYETIQALKWCGQVAVLGVEASGLDEFILQPLKNELIHHRMIGINLVPLYSKSGKGEFSGEIGAKKARIANLVPFYRNGYVLHIEGQEAELERQLTTFPMSDLWDVMDAASYLHIILDDHNKFFRQWVDTEFLENEVEATDIEFNKPLVRRYTDYEMSRGAYRGGNI